MKKLIYILVLFFAISAFSQDVEKKEAPNVDITNISVCPNPFTEKTNISFSSSTDATITFTVQNLLGNVVISEEILLINGKNIIPVYRNKLTSGIYIYSIKTKTRVISKRFVIK